MAIPEMPERQITESSDDGRWDTRMFDSLSRPLWIAMLRCYRSLRGIIRGDGTPGTSLHYGMTRDEARELVGAFFREVDWREYLGSK